MTQTLVGWLATYAFHSTLLLGATLLLARRLRSEAWRETAWKAALVGGLLTASLQTMTLARPLAGRWPLPAPTAVATDLPTSGTATAGVPERIADGLAARGVEAVAEEHRSEVGPGVSVVRTDPPPREAGPGGSGSVPGDLALSWLLLAWISGAALLVGRITRQHLRLARVLRGRRPVREARVLGMIVELCRSAGIARPIRLTASNLCPTPLALRGGEICIPERLLGLEEEQQRSALAHELAHLVRRDPEWHLAAALLEAVFFFQPLNRAARRALREAAEHQCDDWAIRQTGSPLALARCLLEVAAWVGADRRVPTGVLAMAEADSPLVRRVERLLGGGPRPEAPGRWARASTAAGLVALTAVAAPAISPGAVPPSGGGAWINSVAGSLPRLSARQEVIAHPSPASPLEEKWAWAEREAGARGHAARWVAWSFERLLPAGSHIVEDSDGWNTDEWSREPLGRLLFGPTFRVSGDERSPVRQPVIVLLHLRGNEVDRVAVRSASLGMDLREHPVYWLGSTPQDQSLGWLVARTDRMANPTLAGVVVEAVALHEDSERVVSFLEDVIRSGRPARVREEAIEGLGWHRTDRAVRVLRATALGGGEIELRAEAAETLGEMEGPAAEAALREVVASTAPLAVRLEVVEGMGERSSPVTTAELARIAAEDPSEAIQAEAVETLGEHPAAQAAPLLERIARTHPNPSIQEEALETLMEVDPARADRLLEGLLRDSGVSVRLRMEALDALAERRTPRAAELVHQAALTDPSLEVQIEAVDALAEFPPEEAAPRLERIIWEHPRKEVRLEAVESAAELPGEFAARILDRVLREHPDAEVLHEALDALEDLPEEIALPLLIRAAREHPRADVREEAREKLGETVRRRLF